MLNHHRDRFSLADEFLQMLMIDLSSVRIEIPVLLERCVEAWSKKRLEEVESCCEMALELHQDTTANLPYLEGVLFAYKGAIHWVRDDLNTALDCLYLSLRHFNDSDQGGFNARVVELALADVLVQEGQFERALEMYQKGLKGLHQMPFSRGQLFLRKKFEERFSQLAQLLCSKPNGSQSSDVSKVDQWSSEIVSGIEAYAVARIEDSKRDLPLTMNAQYKLFAGLSSYAGKGFTEIPIKLRGTDVFEIDVVVRADGMEILPCWIQTLRFSQGQYSSLVEFRLIPKEAGHRKQIQVEFYFQRHWLAKVQLEVSVVENVEPKFEESELPIYFETPRSPFCFKLDFAPVHEYSIAAGQPIFINDETGSYPSIDSMIIDGERYSFRAVEPRSGHDEGLRLHRGEQYAIVKIQGESMSGLDIHTGDYVLLRRSTDTALVPRHGQVVVAVIREEENQATLKRFIRHKDGFELVPDPENDEYPAFEFTNMNKVEIVGKAIAVLKKIERSTDSMPAQGLPKSPSGLAL